MNSKIYLVVFLFLSFKVFSQTSTTSTWDTKFNFLLDENAQVDNKNLTDEMKIKADGTFNGAECKRILPEYENKSLYSKENLTERNFTYGKVTITVEGCSDIAYNYGSDPDFSGSGSYPENIVLPVKSDSKIVKVSDVTEQEISSGFKTFVDAGKTKLSSDYTIDGAKEIVVYTTATKEAPTCNPPSGYKASMLVADANDKNHLSKSFDNQNYISNSELAFKRSLNLAKLVYKIFLQPNAYDNKQTFKIRTKCTYNTTDSKPKLNIYGMLKKIDWPKTTFKCGEAIALQGRVGNKTVPSILSKENTIEDYAPSGSNGANPPFYQIPKTEHINTNNPHFFDNCYKKFYNETTKYYDKKITPFKLNFNGKSYDISKKENCNQFTCPGRYLEVGKDVNKLTSTDLIACKLNERYRSEKTYIPPGNNLVAQGTNQYTIMIDNTSFKKGERLQLVYDSYYVPDRFILTVGDKVVIDTGYTSNTQGDSNEYQAQLIASGQNGISRPNATNDIGNLDASRGINYVFDKDVTGKQVKLHVFGPFGTTIWRAQVNCPDSGLTKPELIQNAETEAKKLVP